MHQKILAKGPGHGREITLAGHAAAVRDAVRCLWGSSERPTRLAWEWLRFFRLPHQYLSTFLTNLYLAALLHDLGKANDRFQASLYHQGEQAIRHEHLSAVLLYLEPIRRWLSQDGGTGIDAEIIISAVVSHHLKINDQQFAKRLVPGVESFHVFTTASDFTECLHMASEFVGSNPPDLSEFDRKWSFVGDIDPWKGPSGDFGRSMHSFKSSLRKNAVRHRLCVAVKAALIAADSVGSALVREGRSIEAWINECFSDGSLTAEWIDENVIRPRISEIESKTRCTFQWHDFQVATGGTGRACVAALRLRNRKDTRRLELDKDSAWTSSCFSCSLSVSDSRDRYGGISGLRLMGWWGGCGPASWYRRLRSRGYVL